MKKTLYALLTIFFLAQAMVTPVMAVKHVITVGNFFFNPVNVNVNVGDTIRWVWSAGNHTTTSTPGAIPAGAVSWDALINSTNTSFEYKVVVAGSYSYVCTPHVPDMAGTFVATAVAPTLSVAPADRSVLSPAGVTTFSVTSNSGWTAGSDAGWCTITSAGTGNGTITATYTANPDNQVRVATITVTVAGLSPQTVTVTQAPSPVGQAEQVTSELQVYPNPTKGIFKIKPGHGKEQSFDVTILDISGKEILSRNCRSAEDYSFDLSGKPRGYYFIRIQSQNAPQVRRIMLID